MINKDIQELSNIIGISERQIYKKLNHEWKDFKSKDRVDIIECIKHYIHALKKQNNQQGNRPSDILALKRAEKIELEIIEKKGLLIPVDEQVENLKLLYTVFKSILKNLSVQANPENYEILLKEEEKKIADRLTESINAVKKKQNPMLS